MVKIKSRGWLKDTLKEACRLGIYDVGETVEDLSRRLRIEKEKILKLNSNENLFIPEDFLKKIILEAVEEMDPRIYPRGEKQELIGALARHLKVPSNRIMVGTGSDQLIDLISRAFLKDGDMAITIDPTFSMYGRCVMIQGAQLIKTPLNEDFSLNVERILDSAGDGAKLLFLCSPNNPTANQFRREDVAALIEEFNGVVVVDEAYVEFSNGSIIDLTGRSENLIVLRTFSKAFGLAGLRLGYAISNEEITSVLSERLQMPYSVTLTALKTGRKILERIDVVENAIAELRRAREKMIKRLNDLEGIEAFDSQTNFVLIRAERDSKLIYESLLKRGVIIRNIGRVLHFENCLRVTVPPEEMMDRLIMEMENVLNE